MSKRHLHKKHFQGNLKMKRTEGCEKIKIWQNIRLEKIEKVGFSRKNSSNKVLDKSSDVWYDNADPVGLSAGDHVLRYAVGWVTKVKDLREKLFTHCAAVTERLFIGCISATYQSRTIAIPSLIILQHFCLSFADKEAAERSDN